MYEDRLIKRIYVPFLAVVVTTLAVCLTFVTHKKVGDSDNVESFDNFSRQIQENAVEESTQINIRAVDSFTPVEYEDERNNTFFFSIKDIPPYDGKPYYVINQNKPLFLDDEMVLEPKLQFSDFDDLGRCGVAYALLSKDSIPTEDRGTIGDVRPSGWHTVKYNDLIDGNYLYNRCHLIGYQLCGVNADPRNLITGTRYFNVEGMLPFENAVCDYIRSSDNHVLFRTTPIFEGDNLVAQGVTIEALSVEDKGKEISFYVFVYNVQPGIEINYLTGESKEDVKYSQVESESKQIESSKIEPLAITSETGEEEAKRKYILNTNTHKFHKPSCQSIDEMKEKNKIVIQESREAIINQGYAPCKRCNP